MPSARSSSSTMNGTKCLQYCFCSATAFGVLLHAMASEYLLLHTTLLGLHTCGMRLQVSNSGEEPCQQGTASKVSQHAASSDHTLPSTRHADQRADHQELRGAPQPPYLPVRTLCSPDCNVHAFGSKLPTRYDPALRTSDSACTEGATSTATAGCVSPFEAPMIT